MAELVTTIRFRLKDKHDAERAARAVKAFDELIDSIEVFDGKAVFDYARMLDVRDALAVASAASPLPAPQEPAAEPDHELKTWPPFFDEVLSGRKPFEVRKNDRGFAVGHVLRLNEWAPDRGYTGRFVDRRITYILTGPQFGIEAGYVVLGLYAAPATDPTRGTP